MAAGPRTSRPATRESADIRLPATLLGIGLGGFLDGIVLHQILQWHHMISDQRPTTTVAGLEVNTLADGLFHVFAWVAVVVGVVLLAARRGGAAAPTVLWGWLIFGWGLFNLVEGVVDHLLLGVHHVRDDLGGPLSWDLGFVALAVALMVVGWLLQRRASANPPRGLSGRDA